MKIEEKFESLREKGEGAYMPHIYYGDPSPEFSRKEIKTLAENGADFIEFGIPFSDPTADGPTFQDACERALENGITPEDSLQGIEKLRSEGLEIPIIVTTYYNVIYAYGQDDFFERLREVGAQGVIVPNIPLEEADSLKRSADKQGIDVILQVTPNTSQHRLEKIAEFSSGFLYVVNMEGVTGARKSVPKATVDLMESVNDSANIPLMAGFGVSKEIHANELVSAGADGVITGSALGNIYEKNLSAPEDTLDEIGDFASRMKNAAIQGYDERSI